MWKLLDPRSTAAMTSGVELLSESGVGASAELLVIFVCPAANDFVS